MTTTEKDPDFPYLSTKEKLEMAIDAREIITTLRLEPTDNPGEQFMLNSVASQLDLVVKFYAIQEADEQSREG